MATAVKTIQTNIKSHEDNNLTKYALFLGGLDVTHDVLSTYDPWKGGFARIFMTRMPTFIANKNSGMLDKMKKFKHILEYANTGISGISDIDVSTESMTGGYVGRDFAIPMVAKNNTNSFTISTYEFSGSPVRELLHWWISGFADFQSGFSTYHGVEDTPVKQSNHTAEFFYVVTDQTGKNVEYVCMFANCFPMGMKMDHLNYRSGEHSLADYDINFSCVMYDGPQINAIGVALLDKYKILMDSLDFCPKFTMDDDMGTATEYDLKTGRLVESTR